NDEDHVAAVRELYRRKLAILQPGLDAVALANAGGPASFFRWLALPEDWEQSAWVIAARRDPLTAELIAILTDGASGTDADGNPNATRAGDAGPGATDAAS